MLEVPRSEDSERSRVGKEMKFIMHPTRKPIEGETRIIERFLILPKLIKGEWRWLERAKWRQVVMLLTSLSPGSGYSPGQRYPTWVDKEWLRALDQIKQEAESLGVTIVADEMIQPQKSGSWHGSGLTDVPKGRTTLLGINERLILIDGEERVYNLTARRFVDDGMIQPEKPWPRA